MIGKSGRVAVPLWVTPLVKFFLLLAHLATKGKLIPVQCRNGPVTATVTKRERLAESIGQLPQIAVLLVSVLVLTFFSSSKASLILVNKFCIRHLAIIV